MKYRSFNAVEIGQVFNTEKLNGRTIRLLASSLQFSAIWEDTFVSEQGNWTTDNINSFVFW